MGLGGHLPKKTKKKKTPDNPMTCLCFLSTDNENITKMLKYDCIRTADPESALLQMKLSTLPLFYEDYCKVTM